MMLLLSFVVQYKFVFIFGILGVFLFFGFFIFFRRKNRIKKKQEERVIQPITDIIGTRPEQINTLNGELKPFGFAYDPYQDFFYSLMYSWQRNFGYCRLYDEACAPLSMIIDTEPIRFNYNGKKYLIQFWKGQYGMTTGGEVGIYYTSGPDLDIPGVFNGTFYNVVKDEHRIHMSFAFRKNGDILFTRNAYHWWLTGFKLAEFSYPYELSMDIILDLYDRNMALAFASALKDAGYSETEYAVKGRRVYVVFDEPHTKQPFTKTSLTTFFAQKNNRHWCNTYDKLTNEYTDTLSKINFIRNESPDMYQKILNMGKVPEVYDGYKKIESFITTDEE